RNDLAVTLVHMGRVEEAIKVFRETLELDPNRWAARANLGVVLQQVGRYQESLDCFEQSLKANPKALDIYKEIARTYALMGQREKAIATLERGLELARSSGDEENAKMLQDYLNASR